MIVLDGKQTAAEIRAKLKNDVEGLVKKHGRSPCLAVILVGEDPASQIYVRNKERACEEVGIHSRAFRLDADTTQEKLEKLISDLNASDDIDGILLQLPLPSGLDPLACQLLTSPGKDVDGFHPENMGRLTMGMPGLRPCTPAGVMAVLERYDISPAGKHAVVIGRSNIVGKPMAMMLAQTGPLANATVTICHSRTKDLPGICRQADIVIAAVGRPKMVKKDWVKPGAVVIDVGMNRTDEGLCGDVDYEELKETASAMTPVPGGIGPMTIAQLLVNTVEAYKNHMNA
ncbi:bifunctional methylenetetrahydrofolate dehydrogenase/methenyltetrahydrofolate cyclohydrolase FolD [Desulfovibrio inopinatus]|uniref:bifunctional methylenetetrahydrofolate dehydrogenase/methenyltetrahydrofolate cyclohydrolase FolD n=1 Tax=Desulfovibrio inopinatus TaxID=102109 RepID=UPI0003FAB198|nr:bifunctional methylenetetrahydrofolate dehydrogenase/methenyltetrahydrofolate cyclohydrolase FolD [Desulfovibrio inopinatus]